MSDTAISSHLCNSQFHQAEINLQLEDRKPQVNLSPKRFFNCLVNKSQVQQCNAKQPVIPAACFQFSGVLKNGWGIGEVIALIKSM